MLQPGRGEAEAEAEANPAPSANPEPLTPGLGGEQAAASPGEFPEDAGLGLASPLIGALIGLLTLVLPLFAVLDDRPAHPLLSEPHSRHLPTEASSTAPR